MQSVYTAETLMYVKKIINCYSTNSQIHTYNTRGKNKLHTIPHSTSLYSESFIHAGCQLYNTLPGCLKEMPSSKFKSQLQDLLHKKSFYSVREFNEYFQKKDETKPITKICLHG